MPDPNAEVRQYDPVLAEVARDGDGDDEISLIARVSDATALPAGVRVVTRFGDVVTLRARRSQLAALAESPAVVEMEAAVHLLPSVETGDAVSGYHAVFDDATADDAAAERPMAGDALEGSSYTRRPEGLSATGRGVVVGVLDWGADFPLDTFRQEDGSTRLLALWDQRGKAGSGPGNVWGYGRVLTAADIDRALAAPDPYAALGYHPADADGPDPVSYVRSGAHGTHVLDIAAGNGRGAPMSGVAPDADLVFVHLARTSDVLGPRNLGDSASLLEALDFVFTVAAGRPCVVNMSVGAQGGPHDGSTMVEQGIDRAVWLEPGRAVVNSVGNYALARAHQHGRLRLGEEAVLRLRVPAGDPTPNEVEVWYARGDRFLATIVGPDGVPLAAVAPGAEAQLAIGGRTVGHVYHVRTAGTGEHQVNLFLYPGASGGAWEIRLRGDAVQDGRYHAWIERERGPRPRFSASADEGTSTTGTLCNGRFSIGVGAYDPHDPERRVARYSSAGPTRDGRPKPECVAPGDRIDAARSTPRGAAPSARTVSKSGTSMAAPHVAGAIALMFEAAGRPLDILDTRALLLASTNRAPLGPDAAAANLDVHRVGYGYLDPVAAERAAHRWARDHPGGDGAVSGTMDDARLRAQSIPTDDTQAAGGRRARKRHFVLVSGGPGPYDTRDVEHDASWANYVTPPLLMTDTSAKRAVFSATNEDVWWFVYKPAYERRWEEDSSSTIAARRHAAADVGKERFASYVALIEGRATERGWKLRWLLTGDDLQAKLRTFRKRSISRLWYWGHARDDLWLSVEHDSGSGAAVRPAEKAVVARNSIDTALRGRFRRPGGLHRFVGCNTESFAEAWSKAYGVQAEGVRGTVQFRSLHATGGEPCLVGGATATVFTPGGRSARAAATALAACGTPHPATQPGEGTEISRATDAHGPAEDAELSGASAVAAAGNWEDERREREDDWNRGTSPGSFRERLLAVTTGTAVRDAEALRALALDALGHAPEALLTLVGRPTVTLAGPSRPGDLLVRSSPNQGVGYTAVIVARSPEEPAALVERGVPVESAGEGRYVEVAEGRPDGRGVNIVGRRLTDRWGRLPAGQALYRADDQTDLGAAESARKGRSEPRQAAPPADGPERPAKVDPTTPATASVCATIRVPSFSSLPQHVQLVLQLLKVQLPSRARCLDASEVTTGRCTFGNSLVYNDVYVSDGVGAAGRAFTVALPIGHRWIVVLNLGPEAFTTPNFDVGILVHELAHAWQSQHHPEPLQFMVNCLESMAAAAAYTAMSAAYNNRWLRLAARLASPFSAPDVKLEASAYAYVPGKSFADYGGEQIAQQVEDTLSQDKRISGPAVVIRDHMRAVPPGRPNQGNIDSLSKPGFAFRSAAGVVWRQ